MLEIQKKLSGNRLSDEQIGLLKQGILDLWRAFNYEADFRRGEFTEREQYTKLVEKWEKSYFEKNPHPKMDDVTIEDILSKIPAEKISEMAEVLDMQYHVCYVNPDNVPLVCGTFDNSF